MTYFSNIDSLADLKKKYRILAIANHPDKGGDTAVMQGINAEFEKLFKVWEHRQPATPTRTGYEDDYAGATAKEYSDYVYNEYKWVGHRYKGQNNDEIIALIRQWLKETYPRYKFSVRMYHYNTFSISLIHADFEVFSEAGAGRAYHDINYFHIDTDRYLTDRAKEVMKNIKEFIMSYNYDDSDSMRDYFCTNFYLNLNIGTYKSPYKVVTPQLKCAKDKQPPQFKHPEGKAHKAIRQALNGAVFQIYEFRNIGERITLGELSYNQDGSRTFWPKHYAGAKTAQKRIDKLTAAGIKCRMSNHRRSYILFEGYTSETEAALERERLEYTAAKKTWDENQSQAVA